MAFWIPLALMAAAAGAQAIGQSQAKRAMESRTRAEMERQRRFREQGAAEFQASLAAGGRDVADEQIAEGTAKRTAEYDAATAVPMGSSTASTLSVVPQQKVGQAGEQAASKLSNRNRGQFMGLSDWQLKQLIKNARANQQLAITANMAQGSANVLPMELQDASHKGDTMAGISQLLNAAGLVYGLGSMGAGAGASAAGSAPANVGAGSWSGGFWPSGTMPPTF